MFPDSFLRRGAQPFPQGQPPLFMVALVIIYYLFIIYLFTDECIYLEGQGVLGAQCRSCLGPDMFSVKTEMIYRLFPPGLPASVLPFAYVLNKIFI